ncbi:TPA: hypothetical protein ACPPEH_000941 [Haemophilus influenzae]
MSILGSMTDAVNKTKTPQAPTISTQSPTKDTSQTMAGNVSNLLNSNSLLMNSAAAKGERMAANRGLQNSTIGVESAQRAMLDAAIPIASQDTQNAFAEKQTRLQADLNFQNQSKLNQQQNQFTASQAELERGHQRGMAQLQSDLAYNNQSRLNQAQNQFTASQTALERQQQKDMANLNHQNEMKNLNAQVAANTIGKSIDFTMQITSNFDAQIATILNNSNMKAEDKTKAIEQLKASRDSEIQFMSKFMQGIPTTQQNCSSFPSLGVPSIQIS